MALAGLGLALAGSVRSGACRWSGLDGAFMRNRGGEREDGLLSRWQSGRRLLHSKSLKRDLPFLTIVGVDCPPNGFLDNPDECVRVAPNRIGQARLTLCRARCAKAGILDRTVLRICRQR